MEPAALHSLIHSFVCAAVNLWGAHFVPAHHGYRQQRKAAPSWCNGEDAQQSSELSLH